MESTQQTIRNYFHKLGLESVMADIYFCLYTKGPQTISELARNSGIERTRIYRSLDELKASSLVEVEIQYKRQILRAVPVQNLQVVFAKREQTLAELQQQLPAIESLLEGTIINTNGTRIQFYHGLDGVKQMLWNETKADGEAVSILHDNMQVNTEIKFFERWVERCNESGFKHRSVVNDKFLDSQRDWYNSHVNEKLKNWAGRYISKAKFNLTHSTLVYNDVVAYYDWKDGEIFGIEIYNKDIADAQRHFFEMLWQQAETLPA